MTDHGKLLELAKKYGTPLFVYDGSLMLERYFDLFRFIPNPALRVHYALKANYNPALLTLLRDAGAGIDAVSPGEVELALALGFAKDRIIYTANNMTDAEFDRVMKTGVTVNIGSLSRLKKCAVSHPGSRICLRFNPDVCDGDNAMTMTGGDLTKFGILLDDADEAKRIADSGNLHIIGLHEHTGSGLQHVESVLKSMDNLMAIATPERFGELEFLDFNVTANGNLKFDAEWIQSKAITNCNGTIKAGKKRETYVLDLSTMELKEYENNSDQAVVGSGYRDDDAIVYGIYEYGTYVEEYKTNGIDGNVYRAWRFMRYNTQTDEWATLQFWTDNEENIIKEPTEYVTEDGETLVLPPFRYCEEMWGSYYHGGFRNFIVRSY